MKKSFLLAGAALLALSTAATAATFTVDGTRGQIPDAGQTNEVLTNVFGTGTILGFFGSQVSVDFGGAATGTIQVSYFGYEAGFSNSFEIAGTSGSVDFDTQDFMGTTNNGSTQNTGASMFAASAAAPILTTTLEVSAGVLDFSFSTLGGGSTPQDTVENDRTANPSDANTDNTATPAIANFFSSLSSTAETVFLFFDDAGAGDDDNHDDFVVSLSMVPPGQEPEPVPLPAGGLLLLGGLGAFAMTRRRKTKA
ncbi:MAG: VPLPA-CTERM sorting domain-containing protein [Pseudomonadota bacterium]